MQATTLIGGESVCRHVPRVRSACVNGIRVDAITRAELPRVVQAFLECGASHVVNFVPAYPTVLARRDASYAQILGAGDLNLPDGMPVAWMLRLQGLACERVTGADALSLLPSWGRERGLAHYFLGGTAEVDRKLCEHLTARVPGIRIAGVESLPFRPLREDEIDATAARIRSTGVDLVWIGLGTPSQHVLGEALCRLGAAPVILCVGAAFDFVSECQRRAPVWMQRSGLEWLHRLLKEPSRLWRRYLIGNPQFVAGAMTDYLRPHYRR